MRPQIQFSQEALRVISDEEYRQPKASVEFMAALTCFLVMGLAALVLWAHDLSRWVR